METAAELNRRARLCDGWIAPHNIEVLIAHGHVREVRRLAAEGDWYCARAIAADHAAHGRPDQAIALLMPFADTGWWAAVESIAQVLEACGRAEEALDLTLGYAEAGERPAVNYAARLLTRGGRADEAFALLRPRAADSFHAEALVDISTGLGRDQEVIDVLSACAAGAGVLERPRTVGLLATVLERTGRVDEAVAALERNLHVHNVRHVTLVEHLADLLARHGRHEKLRALIDGHGGDQAAYRLARHLEHTGDVAGAIALLTPLAATGRPHPSVMLAELLVRAGHGAEALTVLRHTLVGGEEDWLMHTWAELMAAAGRAEEALAVLDEHAEDEAGVGVAAEQPWELFERRLGLLVESGRLEQAVEELQAHPHRGEWYAAWRLAALLVADGRDEEALAELEASPDRPHPLGTDLHAQLLIGQGRVDEALTLLRQPRDPLPDDWI